MLLACFLTIFAQLHTNMQKSNLLFALILGLSVTFIACSKEDNDSNTNTNVTLPAGVQDTVTSFMVFFTNTTDSSAEVASYDDPDGPGPKQPNVGGVTLNKNSTYKVTFLLKTLPILHKLPTCIPRLKTMVRTIKFAQATLWV